MVSASAWGWLKKGDVGISLVSWGTGEGWQRSWGSGTKLSLCWSQG